MSSVTKIRLKVKEALQEDVGYGRARLDMQTRHDAGLSVGDAIELKGIGTTVASVWRARPSDEGNGTIQIDSITRKNCGVKVGDYLTIKSMKLPEAEYVGVCLQDTDGTLHYTGDINNVLKRGLLKRPLKKGDIVVIPSVTIFGELVPFRVVDMRPGTCAIVGEHTILTLMDIPSLKDRAVVHDNTSTKSLFEGKLISLFQSRNSFGLYFKPNRTTILLSTDEFMDVVKDFHQLTENYQQKRKFVSTKVRGRRGACPKVSHIS
jgi:hypothetical protein